MAICMKSEIQEIDLSKAGNFGAVSQKKKNQMVSFCLIFFFFFVAFI